MKKLTDKLKKRNLASSKRAMEYLSKAKKISGHLSLDDRTSYKSRLINFLNMGNHQKVRVKKTIASIEIPKNFSLIENPLESLHTVLELIGAARNKKTITGIFFNYTKVSAIDISAEGLLAMIAGELKKEYRMKEHRSTKRLRFSGTFSQDNVAKRLVKAIGITKEVGAIHTPLSPKEKDNINVFNLRSSDRDIAKFGEMSRREIVIKKFIEHINDCLINHQRQLTETAVSELAAYIGETLDNVAQHSGENTWSIIGYYDHHDESNVCEVVIFNIGKTFAETFLDLPKDAFANTLIRKYVNKHKKSRSVDGYLNEKNLIALGTIQGDVSSKNEDGKALRGNGTVQMIEFFERMSDELGAKPKMAIVSGSTYMYFDGKYKLEPDKTGRKIIAFNRKNSLDIPPAGTHIKNLSPYMLNGTLIGIKFRITDRQLQSHKKIK